MNSRTVDIHELIAWDLDDYAYRTSALGSRQEEFATQIEHARQHVAGRSSYVGCPALLAKETEDIEQALAVAAQREDLQEEYKWFDWRLGVVDLCRLLAFQRRLVFDPDLKLPALPAQDNWPALISLALGSKRATEHRLLRHNNTISTDISLHSSNPDLQLQIRQRADHGDTLPLSLYGGSPFLEVAELRGRWFLRDGYHRAYRLLQAGLHCIPAVVIHARTMQELGATDPWFFGEEQLFSYRPPQVVDFLEEKLVMRYKRPALRKVIRIRIEESLQPVDEIEPQGE
jgi:hypothetical protein